MAPVAWVCSRLGSGLRAVEEALNEETIRLAVTGLTRSGKTMFLVSLLANLLAMGRRLDTLPALSRRLGGGERLVAVSLAPDGLSTVPRFAFEAKRDALVDREPAWPDRTTALSRIAVTLVLARSGVFGRLVGPRQLTVEFLDYPGEWLLDLPMLAEDYASWSRATWALLAEPARAEASARFRSWASSVRASDRASDGVARQGFELYRSALAALREQGFRWLQPGRALNPGPRGEAPVLHFFPLADAPDRPVPGTLGALLADRHAAYLKDMQATEFRGKLDRFDRQIVLVDVLDALHSGEAAFDDTARAIGAIANALRRDGLLARLLGRAQPKRLAFAATKADHVPAAARPALASLLADLVGASARQERLSVHAIAALRATEEVTIRWGGAEIQAVAGVPIGETARRSFDPGTIPPRRPGADYWNAPPFRFQGFRPPLLDRPESFGVPHLGLDTLLDDVLGDALA